MNKSSVSRIQASQRSHRPSNYALMYLMRMSAYYYAEEKSQHETRANSHARIKPLPWTTMAKRRNYEECARDRKIRVDGLFKYYITVRSRLRKIAEVEAHFR
ncbi:hypothetical protein KIN20_022153 [Parelaphostrongylus tenuis]|uniref:Uncharacterized protein n=1 Tax=Parelaphostrongylus tenuis TaxID=148309 RepID=A0AAD5N5Y5_PARTN|nr:hypothetical protein KIN20_022153 [Parelaphostrongylus tenuis]